MTESPLLSLEGVRAGYGPVEVLKGISLEVKRGEIVALLGANGAGKSTAMSVISGFVAVRAGSVCYAGESCAGLAPHEIVARGIAHVPEGRRIVPRLTVAENLGMGAFLAPAREIAGRIEEMCCLFPILKERRKQSGGTLSGGEQQMLAIARGLMCRPAFCFWTSPPWGWLPCSWKRWPRR